MKEQVEIPLNKKKILPNLSGALVFAILGFLMMVLAFRAKDQLLVQVVIFSIGLASLLFFGLISFVLLAKVLRNKAGMIIDDDGLTDHTSGVSAGFIAWNNIKKINYSYTGNNTSMVIMLKKPEKYIERESNFLKRFAMRMNYRISGSPIHIQVSFLDTDLNTLNSMIANKRFQKKAASGQEDKK